MPARLHELEQAGGEPRRKALLAKTPAGVTCYRGADSRVAARWLHPSRAQRADLAKLMAEMARSIGARGLSNQQAAMLAPPTVATTCSAAKATRSRAHMPICAS